MQGHAAGYSSDEDDDFYVPTSSGLTVEDYDKEFPGIGNSSEGASKMAARRSTAKSKEDNCTLNWSKKSSAQRLKSITLAGGTVAAGSHGMQGEGFFSNVGSRIHDDTENDVRTWVDEILMPYGVCRNKTDHSKVLCDNEEDLVEWLSKVSKAYTVSQKGVSNVLQECWKTVNNPYIAVLYILEHPASFVGVKRKQVRYSVLTSFKEYLVQRVDLSEEDYNKYLNASVQLRALALFATATDSPDSASELMVKCFQLNHISEDLLSKVVVNIIRGLIDKKRFLHASSCINALGLHQRFGVDEICYPLLFQGHLTQVQKYLGAESRLQLAFLKLLDYLLDPEVNVDNVISDYDVSDIKREQLTSKNLLKLGVRLMKLYQVPEAECPNITFSQSHRSLRYWFYQRYNETNMDSTRWEELIASVVGDCPRLQVELIELFIDHIDLDSATRWAVSFNLPVDSLPHQIKERVKQSYSIKSTAAVNDKKTDTTPQTMMFTDDADYDNLCRCLGCRQSGVCDRFHQLNIGIDNIVWVENREKFNEFLEDIYEKEFVGIDAEWRPTHVGIHSATRVALLQLATGERVYLLDMLILIEALDEGDWKSFTDVLFSSQKTVVLGYGIEEDLHMLRRSLPVLQKYLTKARTLDLCTVHSMLRNQYSESHYSAADDSQPNKSADDSRHTAADDSQPNKSTDDSWHTAADDSQPTAANNLQPTPAADDSQPTSADKSENLKVTENKMRERVSSGETVGGCKGDERGLSELVKLCLGKPLDKRMQLSNWERRPLRKSQVVYAALDAHCLLEVYDVLKSKIKEKDFSLSLKEMTRAKPISMQQTKLEKQRLRYQQKPSIPIRLAAQPDANRQQGGASMRPSELRVVCDKMLMGLGRQLRSCGVDVKLLETSDSMEKLVQLSFEEKRIILTRGLPYQQLSQFTEQEFCYCVMASNLCDQLKEIFNYFNINVTSNDIFSRCQTCNNDRYLKVSARTMKMAWLKSRTTLHSDTSLHTESIQTSFEKEEPSLHSSQAGEHIHDDEEDYDSGLHTDEREEPSLQSYQAEKHIHDDEEDYDSGFDTIDLKTLCVPSGAPILMTDLNAARLDGVPVFYVCSNCGHVYWDGSHRKAVTNKFSNLIKDTNN